MRIVIEGPDGSGKSTLIERFLERYPLLRLMDRPCSSDNGPIEGLKEWVDRDIHQADTTELLGHSRLYDRHPLVSELIYSPALGRQLALGFEDYAWLVQALHDFSFMNYMVVYCLPGREVVIENVLATHTQDTDHVNGVRDNIGRIYDLYHIRACIEHMKPYRWRWSYRTNEWSELASTFDRWLTV